MNGNVCEYIGLSNIFDRVEKTLVGQELFLQVESPALHAGVTSDLFRLLGKMFIQTIY